MTIYDKNEAPDLTSTQKKALKHAIEAELEMRRVKRKGRSRRIQ